MPCSAKFSLSLQTEIIYHSWRRPAIAGSVQELCFWSAGPRSAVGTASASRARGPGLDTRSAHILSLLLPLILEGQLSVPGESVCTKYWLTVGLSLPGKSAVRVTDRPDIISAVERRAWSSG